MTRKKIVLKIVMITITGLSLFLANIASAIPVSYQRCAPNTKCVIGEYIFEDDDYIPVTTDEFFRIVFFRPQIEQSGKIDEKWGENQRKIIGLIDSNKIISIVEIAKQLKLGTTTIENNIPKLKQKHLLKRVGPAKGGYWKIIKK